ncbi:MAG: hypothetical protein H0A75_06710 [Candidatus Methanofishera endochildressiae]|uniref:Potassium channel tetramerisation-type BTB domain-containing protein n=1 Tax=Candidatus Methanofishera endochildressiae TaxID=2738884 RepID=A0A7Z0SFE4_9GAMM|nr:hypothetical protein [Candidatus Methanofishera endochildressiae]
MFSGRYPIQKGKDGNYFIDRDGTHFNHILNFLRDERCMPPKESSTGSYERSVVLWDRSVRND